MGVSVYWPLSVLCVFVFVMSNQSTSKKHIMCQTSVNLKPCCIKHHIKILLVPRYQGLLCVDPYYSKIAHQMRRDHPFSQRNRITERTVGVEVGGDREVGERWLDKIWKRRGVSNIGGSSYFIKPTPPSPPIPGFPPFLVKIPPLEPFLKNLIPPPLWRGVQTM